MIRLYDAYSEPHTWTTAEARGDVGAIVSDDEPGAPRRSPVRVMQDACAWLLELGLTRMARRAFTVAEESERLATKKAKVNGILARAASCFDTLVSSTLSISLSTLSHASLQDVATPLPWRSLCWDTLIGPQLLEYRYLLGYPLPLSYLKRALSLETANKPFRCVTIGHVPFFWTVSLP